MVVDAVQQLDAATLDLAMLGTKKVQGGGLRDSFLVDGVAFKKTFSYAGAPALAGHRRGWSAGSRVERAGSICHKGGGLQDCQRYASLVAELRSESRLCAGFEMQPKAYSDPPILLLNIELELKSEKENAEVRSSRVACWRSAGRPWHCCVKAAEPAAAEPAAAALLPRLPARTCGVSPVQGLNADQRERGLSADPVERPRAVPGDSGRRVGHHLRQAGQVRGQRGAHCALPPRHRRPGHPVLCRPRHLLRRPGARSDEHLQRRRQTGLQRCMLLRQISHKKGRDRIVLSRLAIGDLVTQYFAGCDIFCAGRVNMAFICHHPQVQRELQSFGQYMHLSKMSVEGDSRWHSPIDNLATQYSADCDMCCAGQANALTTRMASSAPCCSKPECRPLSEFCAGWHPQPGPRCRLSRTI